MFMLFESCNDEFSVNAPQEDVYILNCILQNTSSIQYAIISNNVYTKDGGFPNPDNNIDQNITGADVKIFYNDSVFVMKDTTIQLTDNGNLITVNCYYTNKLKIAPGKGISAEATLPDGQTLKSEIQVPEISFGKSFSPNFPQILNSGYNEKPSYSWNWIGDTESMTNISNLPQLEIYYQQYEDGAFVNKKVFVPLVKYFILDEHGNLIPVKVDMSFEDDCLTTLETVNETMQAISENDPYKSNYIINKVLFSVTGLDPDLARFYFAYNTFIQDFTIKIRQTDYSNIEGGKGIFGAYYKFSKSLVIDILYIRSFGYRYEPM